MAKIVPKTLRKGSGAIFSEKKFAQSSIEDRVFGNFQKSRKLFKIPKVLKIPPKSIQTSFEHVSGQFFDKKNCPVFHGGSSLQKNQKLPKFQK